jgi:hypothetical protein
VSVWTSLPLLCMLSPLHSGWLGYGSPIAFCYFSLLVHECHLTDRQTDRQWQQTDIQTDIQQERHTHTPKQPEQKKSSRFFRQDASNKKVRFSIASVYAQPQEVSTIKQTQQNQKHHNAKLIYTIAQTNTAWCNIYISCLCSRAFVCTCICFENIDFQNSGD